MSPLKVLAVSIVTLISTRVLAQQAGAEASGRGRIDEARAVSEKREGMLFYEKVILPGQVARCDSYLHQATSTSDAHWHDDPIVSATGACLDVFNVESHAQYFLNTDQSYTDVDGTRKWEFRESAYVTCLYESIPIEEAPQYVRLLCIRKQHP